MDGKEALARYLEQRAELGEHDLVLDTLRRGEVLGRLGGGSPAQPRERSRGAAGTDAASEIPRLAALARDDSRGVARDDSRGVGRDDSRGVGRDDKFAGGDNHDGDWRAALLASEATPPATTHKTLSPITRPSIPAAGTSSAPGQNSLAEIATVVAACTLCALHQTAKNSVPGEGNPNADLMFVGEAPGETEDETGRPFVGRAGQLLTKIIEAIELKREDVFICNVLKHRPPANRNPTPEEIRVCSPYLIRQIELVKPKVIVALGTFAAQTLLDTKTSIGKLRGSVHRYHGVPLIVTYHPAALLRNPAWKRPTWEDIQLARRILESPVRTPDGA